MEKIDARKLSPENQELLRRQAIQLRKRKKTYVEIADILGVHRNTVSEWWKAYQQDGLKGIKQKKRGRKIGEHRRLSKEQEAEIQNLITDKSPHQYKLTFALWSRKAIQELIELYYGIKLPIRTIGDYLKRWNFTPQKPLKRAYEQQPAKVKKWLDDEYPIILKRSKQENAEIHWGDETGLRSDSHHGRSYAPKGKTPTVVISAKRTSINMISTVTNQGKVRFMIYSKTMNAERFIKFLEKLIDESDRKIFLIVDNLRVHHAYLVKDWVEVRKNKIELFFLPAYSPELNPDEYLNGHLKNEVHSKPSARSNEELEKNVKAHMLKLQKQPKIVMNYFKHPKVNYAA